MSSFGIKKEFGWSMIEVNKVVCIFVVGGEKNDVIRKVFEKLREIMLRFRVEGGYVLDIKNVLYDVEDEEKEDVVFKYSEKFVVVFGMVSLLEGNVIRIVKNLRICKDCYIVMKLIFKVYLVDIVVRDRSRFYFFKVGFCICRDYW